MSDWTVRDALPEDEPCLVSMWLKSYAHSRDVRELGFDHAAVDGHPQEIRYWKIHQPIVTSLIRSGTVRVACPPDRATYEQGPAVIAGWACTTPGLVHWVAVKRSVMKVEGAGQDLVRDLLGSQLDGELRTSFDLMDLRRVGLAPTGWRRDRGWLSALRSLSTRVLDRDPVFSSIATHVLDERREGWMLNSERAA